MKNLIRWILASAALTMLFSGGARPHWPVILSGALAAGVFTLGIAWSEGNWRHVFVAVFVFELIVGVINTFDEGVFFHVLSIQQMGGLFAGGTLVSLVLAAILAFAPPVRGHLSRDFHFPGRLWARVAVIAVIYLLLYITAGMFVWPHVKSFYQGRTLPAPGPLLIVEVGRALIFLVAALPWLRILKGRTRTMLFLGLAYSILGGISPLLLPNPIMPANIRLAHGFEVGISNFIFGAFIGWLMTAKSSPSAAPLPSPVSV